MDSGNKRSSLVKPSQSMLAAPSSTMTQLSSQCSAHQLLLGANIKLMEDHTGARLNPSAAHPSEMISEINAKLLNKLHMVLPEVLQSEMPNHPYPSLKLLAKTLSNTISFSATTLITTLLTLIQTALKTSLLLEIPLTVPPPLEEASFSSSDPIISYNRN